MMVIRVILLLILYINICNSTRICKQPNLDLKSKELSDLTQIDFISKVPLNSKIYWLSQNGEETFVAILKANSNFKIRTYVGHAFRIRSESLDKLYSEFVVENDKDDIFIYDCDDISLNVNNEWKEEANRERLYKSDVLLKDCQLDQVLSPFRNTGFHVMCIINNNNEKQIQVFKDGYDMEQASHAFIIPKNIKLLHELTIYLDYKLDTPPRIGQKQAPSYFTYRGLRLISVNSVLTRPTTIFITGGQWIWPPVKIGHKVVLTNISGIDNGMVEIETISLRPKIFSIKNFLLDEECKGIIDYSEPHMKASQVAFMDHDIGKPTEQFRTSSTFFVSSFKCKDLKLVEKRVQELTRVPATQFEDTQVLRYEIGQYYYAHHDYFNPALYQKSPSFLRQTQNGAKNRLATVFFYLSDAEGGETHFPRAGGLGQPPSMKDCDLKRGIAVNPEKRKVIVFYSLLPDGEGDPLSLHGACKVTKGTKWSANFWIWNKDFDNRRYGSTAHIQHASKLKEEEESEEIRVQNMINNDHLRDEL